VLAAFQNWNRSELPAEQSLQPANYTVTVRFAGLIVRKDVIAVAQRLKQEGWKVDEPDAGGGVRMEEAAGLNEVRYGPGEDKAAAEVLRRIFQEAKIGSQSMTLKPDANVSSGSLEVWISRS
jgi:hypothetical protein